MICSPLSLYFSRKSFAPEKATWLMYLRTAVMPTPSSVKERMRCSLSTRTVTRGE